MANLKRLSPGLAPHPVDDLEPFLPLGDHAGDDLGRVLEIGVDDDHGVAGRQVDARGDGHLVAKVPREAGDAEVRVALGQALENLQRAVGAAVVDQHDFVVVLGGQAGQHGLDASVKLLDQFFFAIDRRHQRNQRRAGRRTGPGMRCDRFGAAHGRPRPSKRDRPVTFVR